MSTITRVKISKCWIRLRMREIVFPSFCDLFKRLLLNPVHTSRAQPNKWDIEGGGLYIKDMGVMTPKKLCREIEYIPFWQDLLTFSRNSTKNILVSTVLTFDTQASQEIVSDPSMTSTYLFVVFTPPPPADLCPKCFNILWCVAQVLNHFHIHVGVIIEWHPDSDTAKISRIKVTIA